MLLRLCLLLLVLCSPVSAEPVQASWALSADGKVAAAGDAVFGDVTWWRITDEQPFGKIRAHQDRVHGLQFLDADRLISWSRDDTIVVHSLQKGQVSRWKAPKDCEISYATISPDRRWMATSGGGPALLWDLSTGKCRELDLRSTGGEQLLRFSPNSDRLAVATWDQSVLYDTASARRVVKVNPFAEMLDQHFDPNGSLWTLSAITLTNWDLPSGRSNRQLGGASERPAQLFLSGSAALAVDEAEIHTEQLLRGTYHRDRFDPAGRRQEWKLGPPEARAWLISETEALSTYGKKYRLTSASDPTHPKYGPLPAAGDWELSPDGQRLVLFRAGRTLLLSIADLLARAK